MPQFGLKVMVGQETLASVAGFGLASAGFSANDAFALRE